MQASDRGVRVSKFENKKSIGKFMWLIKLLKQNKYYHYDYDYYYNY